MPDANLGNGWSATMAGRTMDSTRTKTSTSTTPTSSASCEYEYLIEFSQMRYDLSQSSAPNAR